MLFCTHSLVWTAPILEEGVPDWLTECSEFRLDHSSSSVNKWNNETLSDFFTSLFQDQRIMFAPKMFHRNSDSMNKSNFDTISHPLSLASNFGEKKAIWKTIKSQTLLSIKLVIANGLGSIPTFGVVVPYYCEQWLCTWHGWMFKRWTI